MEMNKTWPSLDRYQIAVQSPQNFFRDPRLKDSVVERRGIFPTTRSGNFGSVYKFTESYGRSWAVKVFIKAIAQRQSRYEMISKESGITKVKQLLWFEYQPEGILVDGQWYPLLLMEWGAGDTLIDFFKQRFEDRQTEVDNATLSTNWIRLMHDLETIGVAHGDLQHGNILVTENGEMTLVDYDGMYVPAMQGEKALELGVPAYQHPQRNDDFFNARLDDFSAMAILVQLMSVNSKLWQTYHKDDGHLLLTQEDIKNPDASPLFKELLASSNLLVRGMTESLVLACKSDIRFVPKFSKVLKQIKSMKRSISQPLPLLEKGDAPTEAPIEKGEETIPPSMLEVQDIFPSEGKKKKKKSAKEESPKEGKKARKISLKDRKWAREIKKYLLLGGSFIFLLAVLSAGAYFFTQFYQDWKREQREKTNAQKKEVLEEMAVYFRHGSLRALSEMNQKWIEVQKYRSLEENDSEYRMVQELMRKRQEVESKYKGFLDNPGHSLETMNDGLKKMKEEVALLEQEEKYTKRALEKVAAGIQKQMVFFEQKLSLLNDFERSYRRTIELDGMEADYSRREEMNDYFSRVSELRSRVSQSPDLNKIKYELMDLEGKKERKERELIEKFRKNFTFFRQAESCRKLEEKIERSSNELPLEKMAEWEKSEKEWRQVSLLVKQADRIENLDSLHEWVKKTKEVELRSLERKLQSMLQEEKNGEASESETKSPDVEEKKEDPLLQAQKEGQKRADVLKRAEKVYHFISSSCKIFIPKYRDWQELYLRIKSRRDEKGALSEWEAFLAETEPVVARLESKLNIFTIEGNTFRHTSSGLTFFPKENHLKSMQVGRTHWQKIMEDKKFPTTYDALKPFLEKTGFRLPTEKEGGVNELIGPSEALEKEIKETIFEQQRNLGFTRSLSSPLRVPDFQVYKKYDIYTVSLVCKKSLSYTSKTSNHQFDFLSVSSLKELKFCCIWSPE